MALTVAFSPLARRQLAAIAKKRPALLGRVFEVVGSICSDPFHGLHKPEPLRSNLTGYWSVRLNKRDRLVFRVAGDVVHIESLEGHYADR